MDATRPWRLEGVVQPYAWGSATAIPELLGREPTGEPQAELWLGAHPRGPARVMGEAGESIGLDEWIRRDPEAVLGTEVARRFGGSLPFLLKILAADAPLSIQAHPSREQARAGFARENAAGLAVDAPDRCYRDQNHKPELVCALTPFRALNRFREPGEIADLFEGLGLPQLAELAKPLREAPDRTGLADFFEAWMTVTPERRRARIAEAATAAGALAASEPAYAALADLAHRHPSDAGALAPLFLNLLELAPGEAMYLPAGELHAYLSGMGIELMASSDNVLRGGLTTKHVDVPELLATLGFGFGRVGRLRPEPVDGVEARYATPAEEFALSVLRLVPAAHWRAPSERGPEILFCTEGVVRIATVNGGALELGRGESALLPTAARDYGAEGAGIAYRAGLPPDWSGTGPETHARPRRQPRPQSSGWTAMPSR